ncbi:MAG: hypothetical protein SPJ83_06455 [Helicobacter sp.]|uniref:Uncharacterized protein n=1 Tax=Helicobacter bilis TaxID=37372 RepID=A0A1Q2LG33_9HELI|nr:MULTISPECIES: hypothetical protein [Helicobacter]AQQ58882.1 hypothetical protein XJ32_00850 [Helicobacter bilis]MDY5822412.1 hypothetical protein [Helicobacter sp.]
MTLIVENVKKEYVEAFKGLSSGVKANMKVFVEYNNTNDNLTKNDYTDELKQEVLVDKTQNNTNERIDNV